MALLLMRSTREADVRSGARLRLDALAQCHCKVPWDAKSVLILLFCFTTILMPFLNAYPRSVMIYPLTHDPFVTTILAKICTISVNVELYYIYKLCRKSVLLLYRLEYTPYIGHSRAHALWHQQRSRSTVRVGFLKTTVVSGSSSNDWLQIGQQTK